MECPVKLLADGRRDDAALFNLRQPAIMLPDTGRYRYAADCLPQALMPCITSVSNDGQ